MLASETEDVRELRLRVRTWVDEWIIPLEPSLHERETNSEEVFIPEEGVDHLVDPIGYVDPERFLAAYAAARDRGLFGLDVPRELGGQDVSWVAKVAVMEELGRSVVRSKLPPDAPNLHWLLAAGTAEQYERYVRPYARGEISSALALTEEGAGSDVSGIETRAVRDGDEWVLNGTKKWVGSVDWASFTIVVAVTDPEKGTRGGMTAFIVDRGTPGVNVKRRLPLVSFIRPQEVEFTNVRLSDAQVLGEVGFAFVPLTNRLSVRRLELAAESVGAAKRLIEMSIARAKERVTFGLPLSERQTIRNWIADDFVQLQATKLAVRDVAERLDAGQTDVRLEAGAAKMLGTEMLQSVADHTMQIHGALGMSKYTVAEGFWRHARVIRVGEGTTEIQRDFIARELIKNGLPEL